MTESVSTVGPAANELPVSMPDSQASLTRSPDDKVKYWLQEIRDSLKREKDWRKCAREAVALYEGDKKKDFQYNILYSNTDTFAPALYNSTPRPVVSRRFKDDDPLGKVASEVVTRALEFLADTNEQDYETFDNLMSGGVLSALLTSRGVTKFKHDALFTTLPNEAEEANDGIPESRQGLGNGGGGEVGAEAGGAGGGVRSPDSRNDEESPDEEVKYETVCGESIAWDRFTHGYAKQWKNVPWVAFDWYMTREELCENFGLTLGRRIELTETEKDSEDGKGKDQWTKRQSGETGVKLALVHEIWNKVDRTVIFISPGLPDEPVREVDDPLELTGFFPMPRPLSFFPKVRTLVPTTLYTQYEDQAKELNVLTARIRRIIQALKVRGMYDKRITGIDQVLQQEDNVLLPAENMSQIGDMSKLDQAIWLVPIEKLVIVVTQLYTQREQCKAIIYELTGVADIMRGDSDPNEALGTQQIKQRWGTMRLRKMQKIVQDYARESFRIMSEIAVKKLSESTLKKMTGLPFPTAAEKAQAQSMLALASALPPPSQIPQNPAAARGGTPPPAVPLMPNQAMPAGPAPAANSPSGQPALPAQSSQPAMPGGPQANGILAQASSIAQQPSWGEILGVLRDDLSRSYKVDIETNSTIDPEATEDQANIGALLNAIAQFLNGVAPLVEQGVMPMKAAQGILLAVTRRFRFGPEIEDYLKEMQPPNPQSGPGAAAALKAQAEQIKMQAVQQQTQMEMQAKAQDHAFQMQDLERKSQFRLMEHQLKMAELEQKAKEKNLGHVIDLVKAQQQGHIDLALGEAKLDLEKRA